MQRFLRLDYHACAGVAPLLVVPEVDPNDMYLLILQVAKCVGDNTNPMDTHIAYYFGFFTII